MKYTVDINRHHCSHLCCLTSPACTNIVYYCMIYIFVIAAMYRCDILFKMLHEPWVAWPALERTRILFFQGRWKLSEWLACYVTQVKEIPDTLLQCLFISKPSCWCVDSVAIVALWKTCLYHQASLSPSLYKLLQGDQTLKLTLNVSPSMNCRLPISRLP